jgi:tRNA A-37 threonylcarbamoyl transferase component Bud32
MAFRAPRSTPTSSVGFGAPAPAGSSSGAFNGGDGGPPMLRGSSSFMMLETGSEGAYQSDSFAAAQRLYTPQPPDVASQRWKNNSRISAGSHGQGQGPRSSFGGADSDLSTAMTSERMPFAAAQMQMRAPVFDVDSPAVKPSRPSVEEMKVPSCPQKQSSNARKPTTCAHPGDDAEESIHPRALSDELDNTDVVAELCENLSEDMMIQSPAGPAAAAAAAAAAAYHHQQQQAPALAGSAPLYTEEQPTPVQHRAPHFRQQPTPTRPPPPLPADVSTSGDAEGGGASHGTPPPAGGDDSSMLLAREAGERRNHSQAFGLEERRKRPKIGDRHSSGLRVVGGLRLIYHDDHDDNEPGDGSSAAEAEAAAAAAAAAADAAAMPPPSTLPPPSAPHHASHHAHSHVAASSEGGGVNRAPGLRHQNSMVETKMLFTRAVPPLGRTESIFKFEDHFTWLGKLGSGSFSDVYAVCLKSRPNERYAVKCSKREFKSRGERSEFLREVELANQMPVHPNVVQYYRAWQEHQVFCVQMELCANGTLRHTMQREGEALRQPSYEYRIWEIILHITRGLSHIHTYQVMHCDLKPENILVSAEGAFKIGDLGLATSLTQWDEQEGDARYLSRDLLDAHPSFAADIFSFGMMIYEIATGETLPGHGPRWDYLRSGTVPPLTTVSPHLAHLISASMSAQPTSRPSAQQIMQLTAEARVAAAQAQAMAASTAARAQAARPPPPPPESIAAASPRAIQSATWARRG